MNVVIKYEMLTQLRRTKCQQKAIRNKVAPNPTHIFFLNFAKSCVFSYLSKVDNIKKITLPLLNYKPLKVVIIVF